MKRLFPIALLLCLSFSLSSFAPARQQVVTTKSTFAISWPVTGTGPGTPVADQPCATLNYSINGGGDVPYSIQFYYGTTPIGSAYPFTNSGSPNSYYASSADLRARTGIIYVQFVVGTGINGYTVSINGLC